MSFSFAADLKRSTLRNTASNLVRLTVGAVVGAGLFGAVAFAGPAQAAESQAQVALVPTAEAAANVKAAPAGSGPKLWVIKDEDSTLYLFGSVHVLKPDTAWGAAKVDKAFAGADEVWFEVPNMDDMQAMAAAFQTKGFSPDRPLSKSIPAADLAAVDAAMKEIGASAAAVEPMRPWMVGLSLGMVSLAKSGYQPTSGVDPIFLARARAAGKPIKGLETIDVQVDMLAGMSDEAQLKFLQYSLTTIKDSRAYMDSMVQAWATGDVAGLERLLVTPMKTLSPEVNDAFLTRRNTSWADQIQTLLAGKGTAFIVVGAAHLAGEDSVQAILAKRGVKTELVKD